MLHLFVAFLHLFDSVFITIVKLEKGVSSCIGCEERITEVVQWRAANNQSQKSLFKKKIISFLIFYVIAIVGFVPKGTLQWLWQKGTYAKLSKQYNK